MQCINCRHEHEHPFCPQCGEKVAVPKITFNTIFYSAFSTISNMDKGFLLNVRKLLFSPKRFVKGYIAGKRKHVFNPISFLIISITVYILVNSFIKKEIVADDIAKMDSYKIGYEAGQFIKSYLKYFWVLGIIWLSLATKVFFSRFNYAEHLAINAFVMGQATLFGILFFVFTKLPILLNPVVYLSILWMTYQIHKRKRRDMNTFWEAVGAVVFFFIQLLVIVTVIGILRS